MSRVILSALVLFFTAATQADEHVPTGPLPNVAPPLLLQLDGVVAGSRRPAERKGFTAVSLAFVGSDARQWIGVNEARTVGGDQPLDGKAVLEQVEPFTPNFLVAGSNDLITRLRDARPGTHVRIEGLVERGSRTYQLRRVETEPPARAG